MYNAIHTHLYHVNTGDIGAFAGMPLETLNMAGCGAVYDEDGDLVDSKITGAHVASRQQL